MKSGLKTLQRYLPFLLLGPLSNLLWAFWVLPEIGEEGTRLETLEWMVVQALLPLLLGILVIFRRPYLFWVLVVYGVYIALYGAGTLGWALMGPGTPLSVYVVCLVFFVMGFGILYHAMKDLGVGKREEK